MREAHREGVIFCFSLFTPPRLAFGQSTLPLQGRVKCSKPRAAPRGPIPSRPWQTTNTPSSSVRSA
jgi:hypothetical protein